ncbi:MAG: hypothetical protein LBE03_02165, partial [Candidatus Nomurabacteria bacterium]|nr:hypothetical protein [Candidatus Nomurabacteria bacterium]
YRFKDSVQSDIKPDWKSAAAGQLGSLKDAEKKAEKKQKPISDKSTVGSSNEAENATPPPPPPPPFDNKVTGDRCDKNSPFNKAFPQIGIPRQLIKKFGPVGLVAGLIVAGALTIFGSQAILPFHVLEMLVEDFNSLEIGTNLRTKSISKNLLDERTDPTRKKLFSFNELKYKSISDKRQTALKKQGIEIYDKGAFPVDADGNFDGNIKRIADTDSVDDLLDSDGMLRSRVMLFDDGTGVKKIVTAAEFETFFNTNPNFRNGYLNGSRTWAGRFAGWFDRLAVRFLSKWSVTRNLFKNYIANVNDREAGNRAFIEAMAAKAKAGELDVDGDTGSNKSAPTEDSPDATERRLTSSDSEIGGRQLTDVDNSNPDKIAARTSAKNSFSTKISAIAGASDLACGLRLGVAAVGAIAAAMVLAKLIDYASSFAESVDKAKAGEGDGSPIHEFSNILTEPAVLQDVDENDNIYDVAGAEPETPMEASGMAWVTTGSPANQDGISETRYSMEGALIGLGVTKNTLQGCMGTKAIAAIASVAITIGTLGIGSLIKSGIKALGKVFVKFGGKVVLATGITALVGAFLPKIANVFVQDLVSDISGEDVGNALVSGSHAYQSSNHQTGGGSPADSARVLAFRREQKKVIAMNAELDRQTYSPFDITNKNTFFGSVVSKALPFFSNFPTITQTLSTLGALTKQSAVTLLPTASALDDVEFEGNKGDCPALNSIGAEGDIYCQPYFVSDTSTKKIDPDEIMEKVYSMPFQAPNKWLTGGYNERQHNFILETDLCDQYHSPVGVMRDELGNLTDWGRCITNANSDGFDNIIPHTYTGTDVYADSSLYPDGNEQIKTGSNLYAYIVFCSNRGSTFGTNDASIIDEFLNPVSKSSVASTIVGLVPIAGEIMDLVEAGQTTEALDSGWVYGENCVATDKNKYWDSEMVYYQQYIEDNRIVENMGGFENTGNKSPVVAMLEGYDEAHPEDNTFEGQLARKSGIRKEEVVKYLAVIEDYIDGKLDPTYIASLYPTPYGWGVEENYNIEELRNQKTVLAQALKKFDGTKIFSMMTFSENRRKWVVDLV